MIGWVDRVLCDSLFTTVANSQNYQNLFRCNIQYDKLCFILHDTHTSFVYSLFVSLQYVNMWEQCIDCILSYLFKKAAGVIDYNVSKRVAISNRHVFIYYMCRI